ncbi:hypothetical protein C2S53_006486 [Perilla frutescens var. hirtella]|uniref:Pectinesterase inhibitor domain-containing protein n=1 Tax=Perilla frutescens var. hirtella TaxID=608512 RepID=A0AAD4ITU4_PERFH|nr:hypothetical protein C2S53_006486 [Perilla frutescens var. hirtella]
MPHSNSIISFPTHLFTSFIMFIISTSISLIQCSRPPTMAPALAPPTPPLFHKACCNSCLPLDTELCLRILESIPKVVSAKDLDSLAMASIEVGISNSTSTRTHIEATLNGKALDVCKNAHDRVIDQFSAALQEVKIHLYDDPSLAFLEGSMDYVEICDKALAKQKVGEDDVISRGNKAVPIFGLSACGIVRELEDLNNVAPSPYDY